ncbi:MAG TPA: DUF3108 domain-containing protein [Anaeromyxobacteraceae bacterium]|nr:DUF3108 domain-containing protein [Anaeromyxobacteraceae bacterium]
MIAASLLALALGAAPACGLPPLAPGGPPWKTGEALTFDLDLLGMVRAGSMSFAVERPMSGGAVIPLRARARSTAAVGNVKKLAAVGLSWIDARTLLPERYREESQEDDVHRVTDARLPPAPAEIVLDQQVGDRKGTHAFAREGAVLDAVSALYLLRAAALAPGERFCFDLVGTGRFWRLEGTVAAKPEKVETPAGKFDTLRVDATARRTDGQGARREVHLWFSTDARRLPVAAVSEIDLGPVRAMLTSVQGDRRHGP